MIGIQWKYPLTGLLLTLLGLFFSSSMAEARKEDPARYVVTLATAKMPPEPRSATLPAGTRTYISSFKRNGKVLYRLRLGFFPSRKAAEEVARRLSKSYPRAWATRVPKKEKRRVLAGQLDPRLSLPLRGVLAGH